MDLSNYDNRTALHIAASYKQDFIVDFLLEKCHLSNASREAIDRWGVTPLMEAKATHAVTPEVYIAFLRNCQIVNTENDDYRTFRLLNAGAKDDLTELKTLHDKKIDMNLRDYDGRTALHLAAAEGNIEAVKFLVNTGKVTVDIPDREGRRPIDEATNEEIKNYLKFAPHDATKSSKSYEKLSTKDTDMTNIMKTVSEGRLHKLNDERLDFFSMDSCDYFKNTPLHVASAKARLEDVEYLLHKRQVSPFVRNSFMETPLDLVEKKIKFWERKARIMTLQDTSQDMQMERSREDDFSKVKKQLKEAMASASKDDVEEDDTFKIHTKEERLFLFLNKAYKGDLKSIRRYLKTDKTLIGEVNYDKRSALHLAAAEGHYDLVRFILDLKDYPVNVNAEDRWKKTPLLDAKRIADEDIINLLLDANKVNNDAEV